MTIFYFTSTGNCLAVAKEIGGTLISIPQVVDVEQTHYKDEVIGLVFPIYFFTTPKIVRRFLDRVKLEADYTFAIGTYGSMPGATMGNVQKLARKNGYRFDYANHLLMADNYLPMFEMGAELKKLPAKQVETHVAAITADIHARKHRDAAAWPGSRALTAIVSTRIPAEDYAKKLSADHKCNKCGICPQVCPRGNIVVADEVQWGNQCEACLACAHFCPQNAIHVKGEKSDKRWCHPEVTLKEIIEANNILSS